MSAIIALWSFLSTTSATVAVAPLVPAYTAENINGEIARHLGFVRACYQTHPPRPGGHGGKRLRLRFRLAADGNVDAVITRHDSLDSNAASACVRRLAHTWRFPSPPSAGAEFEFSFRFR